MLVSRVLSRVSRRVGLRTSSLSVFSSSAAAPAGNRVPMLFGQFHSLPTKLAAAEVSLSSHLTRHSSALQRFGFSSSASSESDPHEKENNAESSKISADAADKEDLEAGKAEGKTKESDLETDADNLSRDDLLKLVVEKEELLKAKHQEIDQMKDKVLRTYAEMENVMDRTRREAENSKKFAIQNFSKGLLDVADNLGRASSAVKESFSKIDASEDTTGTAPLLKTLLEGVEMTEKQLAEVFKKFGVEKYDPINEPFDPNRHNAVFQVPDDSKPEGTIAHVLKPGYMLYERVLRPAEVGVTVENRDSVKDSEA